MLFAAGGCTSDACWRVGLGQSSVQSVSSPRCPGNNALIFVTLSCPLCIAGYVRYARQLIHLTRYDAINNPEPEVVSRTQKLNSENNKAKAKKKVNQAATKSSSATESPAPPNALTYPGRPRRERMASADAEDPTQLDTLILSPDEVDYLNSLTKHEASVAQDQKEESSTLTDSEFHDWILSRAKAGSADAEYALCKV